MAIGAGLCPAGLSVGGYGVPGTTNAIIGLPFANDDGVSVDARRIDPSTNDYVIDSNTGRIEGMNSAQQQVFLALLTIKGSAADINLGIESLPQTMIPNITSVRENEIRQALNNLTSNNIIEIVSIEFTKLGTTLGTKITWMDLTTDNTKNITNI